MSDVIQIDETDVQAFVTAYIVCALWCGVERKDDDPQKDHDKDYDCLEEDIDETDLAWLKMDAGDWCRRHYQTIVDAEAIGEVKLSDDTGVFSHAGHDFWLTRNGHGAGFWGGDWPEPYAAQLTEAARRCRQIDLFIGDDDAVYKL